MYVNVSDIATFIGQNKWDIVTPFERLWKNNDYSFLDLVKESQETSPETTKDMTLTKKEKIEKYLTTDCLNDNSITPTEKKKILTEAIAAHTDLSSKEKDVLVDCVVSTVNTEHGIKNEEKVIEILNKTQDINIVRENKLYKK